MTKIITYVTLFGVLVSGCSNLPATVDECNDLYEDATLVFQCAKDVIAAEDNKYKRKVREEKEERESKACWLFHGGYWDASAKVCRAIYRGSIL